MRHDFGTCLCMRVGIQTCAKHHFSFGPSHTPMLGHDAISAQSYTETVLLFLPPLISVADSFIAVTAEA